MGADSGPAGILLYRRVVVAPPGYHAGFLPFDGVDVTPVDKRRALRRERRVRREAGGSSPRGRAMGGAGSLSGLGVEPQGTTGVRLPVTPLGVAETGAASYYTNRKVRGRWLIG